MALVIIGAVGGLLSMLLYLAIRPWLPGDWPARGLVLGLLLLSPIGIFISASSAPDFDLVSKVLIFALFAGMILAEGLATAWATERLGRGTLPAPEPRPLGFAVLGTIGSLGFVALARSLTDVL